MEAPEAELSKKLIHLVKERPYLYNKDLEDYRDEAKKFEGWSTVAQALGLEVEETQLRWARLRVDFGRHRRKRQAAEACGSQIRDWPLYGLLTWLAPHVKMRAKREKRKREKVHDQIGYKPILPRPEWYVNMHGGVSVEVNPDLVMQNGHEDITESFIVSPDTADYDDDASLENSAPYHANRDAETAQLTGDEIERFVSASEVSLSDYRKDLRVALGSKPDGSFLYTIKEGRFSWKKRVDEGLTVCRGQIAVKEEPICIAYEAVLDSLLEANSRQEKCIDMLEEESKCLKTDYEKVMTRMNEITDLKEEWETKLYGQFVAVLNAKKEKIQALEEALDEQNEGDNQAADEDPFDADTDIDSDVDAGAAEADSDSDVEPQPQTPVPGPSYRRPLRMDSFESPDSPVMVLPKRQKLEPASQFGSASSSRRPDTAAASATSAAPGATSKLSNGQGQRSRRADTQELLQDF